MAVTVNVDITAKRQLTRRVFAEACAVPDGVLACVDEPTARKVRLHRGRNRLTVRLVAEAQKVALDPAPAGWDWGRAAWLPDGLVPVPADTAFFWFGQRRASEVTPAPEAQDTKEGTP